MVRVTQAETPYAESVAACTFFREHQALMRGYVSLLWKHPARQVILSEAAKIFRARYVQQDASIAPLDVAIDHLLLTTNNLLAWYLDHIDEYTVEQAAAIYDGLVVKALEHLALVRRDEGKAKRGR